MLEVYMKIDNNPIEIEAMENFHLNKTDEAHNLQNMFLEQFHESLKCKEDYCSCTADCVHHGCCMDCVILHRGHGDHLPECMHDLFNKKLLDLSKLSEHSIKKSL